VKTIHTDSRHQLPETRRGLTLKDHCGNMEYFTTVNFFDNGQPAELFVRIAKEGSTVAGLIEALAITASIALQYGTPWQILYDKYLGQIFEPRDDKTSSLVDAISKTIDRAVKIWNSSATAICEPNKLK